MKIYTASLVPILATLNLAEGARKVKRRREGVTNKPNGAKCSASSQCRSKCCSRVSMRSNVNVCMSVNDLEDGMDCIENVENVVNQRNRRRKKRNVPGSGKD